MFHRSIVVLAAAAALIPTAGSARAASPHHRAGASVRETRGYPSEVTVDGQSYKVCSKTVVDSCINPRQAGLHFGNRPMADWPGQPASMKK